MDIIDSETLRAGEAKEVETHRIDNKSEEEIDNLLKQGVTPEQDHED